MPEISDSDLISELNRLFREVYSQHINDLLYGTPPFSNEGVLYPKPVGLKSGIALSLELDREIVEQELP